MGDEKWANFVIKQKNIQKVDAYELGWTSTKKTA